MDSLSKVLEFRKSFSDSLQDPTVEKWFDKRDILRIETNDKYVQCFLNAKDENVKAGVKLALEVLKWRNDRNINDLCANDIDLDLMKKGVVFLHGVALDNTRLVYLIVRRQTKDIKSQVQDMLCMWLEGLHQKETGKHITFILDVSKSNMSNVDLTSIKFLLDCFTTYFPDILEKIIIVEMPWIMNAIWKIVKQWMSEEQRRRTVFCAFKDLHKHIGPDNMLTYMGGKDDWEYTFPPSNDEARFLKLDKASDLVPEASAGPMLHTSGDTPVVSTGRMGQGERFTSFELDDCDATCEMTDESGTMFGSDNAADRLRRKSISTVTCNADDSYNDYLSPKNLSSNGFNRSKPSTVDFSSNHLDNGSQRDYSTNQDMDAKFVNGVNLKSLLIMSPATEVVFRQDYMDARTGRYLSFITLTNLSRGDQVAYKIKTNSPDHYLVKPNTGFVSAGDTVTVFMYLNPGFEHAVTGDRFLILYQRRGNAHSVKDFWRQHSSKSSYFEHRVQVKFFQPADTGADHFGLPNPPFYSEIGSRNSINTAPDSRMIPRRSGVEHKLKEAMSDEEYHQLTKEVSALKTSLRTVETNSDRLWSKLRFSLIMHCFVIFLLFYVVLKLFVLTSLLQLGQSW